MARSAKIIGLGALLISSRAWAHGEHEAGGLNAIAPLWVWAAGGALVLGVFAMLYRQAKQGRLIGERFRGFSRNARLLLVRSPFSGLSASLLRLLFNLYLLAVGYDTLFVAKFAAINWTCQIGRAHV